MWSQLSLTLSSEQGMVTAVSVLWTRRGQNCHYSVDKTGSQLSVSVFRNKAWSKLSKSSGQDVVTAVSVRLTRRSHNCLYPCPVDKTWSQLSLSGGQGVVTSVCGCVQWTRRGHICVHVQRTNCGHNCLCQLDTTKSQLTLPANKIWLQLSLSSGQSVVTSVFVQ